MRADAALCPAAHVVDEANGGDGDRRRPGARARPSSRRAAGAAHGGLRPADRARARAPRAGARGGGSLRDRALSRDARAAPRPRSPRDRQRPRRPSSPLRSRTRRQAESTARAHAPTAGAGRRAARAPRSPRGGGESRAPRPSPARTRFRVAPGTRRSRCPPCSEKWIEVAFEVSVAEEQRPRRRLSLGERQRLTLAAPRKPDHQRPGSLGLLRCRVPRAVVRDDDKRSGHCAA